jgi:nucleotide-binding universal stress UspA family protein
MTRPILIGVALRDDDAAPLALGGLLAGIANAPVVLATVVPFDALTPIGTFDYARAVQQQAQKTIVDVAAELPPELEVSTQTVQGSRAGELQRLAHDLGAIAVVVGSSHHGAIGRVLAGDVAAGLLHGAPCPVAVAPRGYAKHAIEKIGVAFAPTEEGRQAATAGFGLARRTGAIVELVSVVEPSAYSAGAYVVPGWVPPVDIDFDVIDKHALGAAERAIGDLGAGVKAHADVRRGSVVDTLAEASRSCDLFVCGSRGYGAVHSALAGGVSRGLAHSAACPLLLVPRRLGEGADVLWTGRTTVSAR